mgnify:FL=1
MKGIFKKIILAIIVSFIGVLSLSAASANIRVSTSKSSPIVGNQITVTVSVSSSSALGSWEYSLSYDSSKLKLMSGDTHIVDYASNSSTKRASYKYTFKVIARGSSSVSISSYNGYAFDESKLSISAGSVRINAITQEELEASYSKNNNLKSLEVLGYTLESEFNKDTLEYVVSVPSDVTKITINGSVEDNTASATGLGEFEVSEGENKFEIKVTAQNGSTKTYTVKVNVEDKNPIEVVIDNEKYTVVKRVSTLVSPSTYEEVKETINGIEVPAFKSSITNYVLVGLKNSSGEAKLYVFDKMNDTYTLYREIKTSGITLFPKESKKELKGFVKETITLNEEKINAYRYKNSKDFYVVYGVNIENNVEGFYQLDTTNNSFVKYDETIINDLNKRVDNYLLIIIVLGVETLILLMVLIINMIRKSRRKKKVKKIMLDKMNEKDKKVNNKEESEENIDNEEKKWYNFLEL